MWWRVEVVGEPHGAELTGEGGSRRSREAEQSAARSVQLHACTGTSLHTGQGLFSSFSTHEIFPSLFSFYFKIWVFVFESVTFCLFRVSFALREIHTGALGIGYLLHSFLHSGKWTSAATLWWFALWLKPCGGQKCLTLLHPPPLAPIFSSLSLFQESKRYQSPCLHLHVTYPQKQSEESGWCGFQIKNLPRVCRLRVSVSPAPPR